MSNSINDLNAIYSSQIQEAPTGVGLSKTKVGADTITPKDASAVGQHVRAIKYEARKSGEPLPVAYNEYVSKNNLTATQRRITRQKLGLAEETSMPHVSKNDKKAIKTRYKGLFKKDLKGNVAGVNENLSNWREDFELREVEMPSTGVTKKKRPKTSDKSREEITDKDVNNKVIINPTMGELINSFEIELEKIGGTLVEMVEIKEVMVDQLPVSPGELIIQKRMAMLNMRLARKNREKVNKVKRGGAGVKDQITAQPPEKVKVQKPGAQTEDLDKYDRYKRMIRHKQDKYGKNIIGADYNLENERKAKGKKVKEETINEVSPSLMKAGQDAFDRDYRLPDGRVKPLRGRVKAKKEADKKKEQTESYESKKKEEVITALKKKKPEFKKRYGKDAPDVMYAVAAKTAKKKGDTSKSDDRYAYEEIEFKEHGESYESKKTSEVIKALTKKKSSFKKRYGKDAPDVMYAVAAKTAKKKGDTSKSDDRYAYEEYKVSEGVLGSPGTKKLRSASDRSKNPMTDKDRKNQENIRKGRDILTDIQSTQKALDHEVGLDRRIARAKIKKEELGEAAKDQSSKQLDRGMKTTQKAMGVIDNSPYGGLSDDKIDRMNKRLKNRRKDVSGEKISRLTKSLGEGKCNCDCGKDPCVKCGEDHHKLGEEISVSGQELKYCKRCRKPETRNDCAYGPEEWDRSAVDIKLGEDKAFDNVVRALRKSHGASGVLTKDSPKSKAQPQPKKKPEKDTRSSAQREVDAQYGRTPWNKKGSLGT